ncbi:36802_t:CDS:2 [Gigaspora margarita]|uniref:36802_t:CDS:1 n=1 Tax=Gigaspora margarita TaxID=4874 RepID=A0ABN7VKI5_GIGMA|nr:36802_t:CDS:2 [Gigaspora margarita]
MTETKLLESTTPRSSLSNPLYTIFTANNDTSTGTVREASHRTAIANGEKLNKQWHNWNNIVKRTANAMIPFTFSSPRKFHAHNFTTTKLHRALKMSFKSIKTIKNLNIPHSSHFIIDEINISIDKIKKLTNIDIQLLPQDALDPNIYPNSLQAITSLKNTIYLARNLEVEQEKKETINGAILRRYTNFTDNTTKMINSIL